MEFRENKGSLLLRMSVYLGLSICLLSSMRNLCLGEVEDPCGFFVIIIGFVFFVVPKLLEKRAGDIFSFGGKNMSQGQRNSYRFGYWLMAVGFLLTFTQ